MTSLSSFALTPGRLILLILLFLMSALAAVIFYLPAAWVWSQIESEVQLPTGITVQAVGGTVWSGTGLLTVKPLAAQERPLRLSWVFRMPSWRAEIPVNWRLETRRSWLQGEVVVRGLDSLDLRVERGLVALAEFSDIARQNGLSLPGSISISDLRLQISQSQLVQASGRGRWEGGSVSWEVGDQSGQAQFPPLTADVREQAGGIALDIQTEAGAERLIDLSVTPNGMATMAVRRRLLELSGMRGGSGAPDDKVFQVQSRVLP